MKHTSIPMNLPCEFIKLEPLNPLISKCQIKVCYVGEQPNRNRTIITKEAAIKMANSLPGSPIVGLYLEEEKDYAEHSVKLSFENGKLVLKDATRPYGFVDLNAKCWFQKFLDDNTVEREYLCTEGYLWTGQYEEAQRIISKGNNHSMEISEKFLNGSWTKDDKGKNQFFIINEAVIEKLCVLGEEEEPCFEGSTITKFCLDLQTQFTEQLLQMHEEVQSILNGEGGANTMNIQRYSLNIGDDTWNSIYNHLVETYPNEEAQFTSKYSIHEVVESEESKYIILKSGEDYSKLTFSIDGDNNIAFGEIEAEGNYVSVEETLQFSLEDVEAFVTKFAEEKKEKESQQEPEKCPECGKPVDECTCEKKDDKAKKYVLEEVAEYVELKAQYDELSTKYANLETEFNTANETINTLNSDISALREYKNAAEKTAKEEMINSFTDLTDEEKADVVANINTYSLDEVEAKLSILYSRKCKNNEKNRVEDPKMTYSFQNLPDNTPDWVKSALETEKQLNNN